MTFQAVDSRVRSAAAVTAKLLAGLRVFLDHVCLHAVQNRRIAEQVVKLTMKGYFADFRFLVIALLRGALSILVCKNIVSPLKSENIWQDVQGRLASEQRKASSMHNLNYLLISIVIIIKWKVVES